MRRLLMSRLIWIFTVCKRMSEFTHCPKLPDFTRLNPGNWLWASAFFHLYFRVYSPIAFGKKTDKNGDCIR